MKIRRLLGKMKRRFEAQVREDVVVEPGVTLDGCDLIGPIAVGFRSYSNDSLLRNVVIGRFCSIGRRCSIGAALHDMDCFTTHSIAAGASFVRDPQTTIGNDVWIGDNVVIVAGVTIGDGAVVGAGAIVTKDVDPYTIVVGIPAKVLRPRFTAQQAKALRSSQWWVYGDLAVEAAGPGASPERLIEVLTNGSFDEMPPSFNSWASA